VLVPHVLPCQTIFLHVEASVVVVPPVVADEMASVCEDTVVAAAAVVGVCEEEAHWGHFRTALHDLWHRKELQQ
jgi:hypothetical protein